MDENNYEKICKIRINTVSLQPVSLKLVEAKLKIENYEDNFIENSP